MKDELYNENDLRRFFLGRMDSAERDRFEVRLVEDAELFEAAEIVESELIDAYAFGDLAAADKAEFERNFLITDARRERVTIAQRMRRGLSESAAAERAPWWKSIGFLLRPATAIGAILIFGTAVGIWFFSNRPIGNEIAGVDPVPAEIPVPTVQSVAPGPPATPANSNVVVNRNRNTANASKTVIQPATPPRSLNPVIALVAGSVRGGGRQSEVTLDDDSRGATMRIKLERSDYRVYRAEILDQDGRVIFRSERMIPRDRALTAFVPASILPRGDYAVRLYGMNDSNEESVADYQFRVLRK